MKASMMNYKDIAELLVKSGADVNAKNSYGATALSLAQYTQNRELIDMLKKSGAKKS